MRVWIDIATPAQTHFFNSIIRGIMPYYDLHVTYRNRAETIQLVNDYNIDGHLVGRDFHNSALKSLSMVLRTIELFLKIPKFDYSMGFGNGMPIAVSKVRFKQSILFGDNDLKFFQKHSTVQNLETKVKSWADHTIVPKACYEAFSDHNKNVQQYNGYKEDIYISDYQPNRDFLSNFPYDEFVVIRPEALGSTYVKEKSSIVKDIIDNIVKENVNIVYLSREKEDKKLINNDNVHIPEKTLSGLDYCFYSKMILTGSGTLAREAACMEKRSISFFPGKRLLSVDKSLIRQGKMFHSRDPKEIVDHVLKNMNNTKIDIDNIVKEKQLVKKQLIKIINSIISDKNE